MDSPRASSAAIQGEEWTLGRLRRAYEGVHLTIRARIVTGLVVLVPLLVTAWVVRLVFQFLDGLLQPFVSQFLGRRIPGVGLLATFILLYFVGLMVQNIGGRTLLYWTERILLRLPVLRDIYGSSKQMIETLAKPGAAGFRRVVAFEYPRRGVRAYGFVTNEMSRPDGGRDIAVFLPTTPNPTSGFLLILPMEEVEPANLTVEEALKMIISGGVVLPRPYREIVDPEDSAPVAPPPAGSKPAPPPSVGSPSAAAPESRPTESVEKTARHPE